jgi:hypothetical protein
VRFIQDSTARRIVWPVVYLLEREGAALVVRLMDATRIATLALGWAHAENGDQVLARRLLELATRHRLL